MALKDEIAADIANLELELAPDGINPLTFTWNGSSYPCVPGSVRRGKTLGSGGYLLEADLVIFVRAAVFEAAAPDIKQHLVFDDRTYRIDDIVTPAGTPFLKLICGDPAQRE